MNIFQVLSNKIKKPIYFLEENYLIEVYYNLEHILTIKQTEENKLFIITSEQYDSETHYKYVQLIAEILKKEKFEVFFKQTKISLDVKIKKLL